LAGLVTTQAVADRTTRYTYTEQGFIETADGPRVDVSDITTYGYNGQGNRTHISNALGQEVRITSHDRVGRPLSITDPNGLTTRLTYDARGWLSGLEISDGSTTRVTEFTYDAVGNVLQIDSPDGSATYFDYDAANRLTGVEDNRGHRIDFTLDAMGNRLKTHISDADGVLRYQQQQVYNQLGRLTQVIDATNKPSVFTYDANGNLETATNPKQHVTQQAYDALDQLNQTIDALNGVTQYSYDAQGYLARVTDPTGLTTIYDYDGLGNLISLTSPDTGTATFTYDEAGNRLTQTDARGITATYAYDALNRLTAISYADSGLDVSYDYDEGTNGIGRLTTMSDASGATTYHYNAFGELTNKTRTANDGITTTFSYTYDEGGRLASMTYPSGRRLSYSYDSQGVVESLSLHYLETSGPVLAQAIHYLPFGPIQSLSYGNGLSLSRHYDKNYRLVDQMVPGILQSSYQYDAVGNITQWQETLDTGQEQRFGYDKLERLVSASGLYGELAYSYDGIGNRLSYTEGSQVDTYSYVVDTHHLQQILGSATDERSYDAAGNTIESLIGSYSYNDANRIERFSKSGTLAEYAYTGQGERIRKTLNGKMTRYRYGEYGELLGEYDQSGTLIREYVYLDGQPLALMSGDQKAGSEKVFYLHTDHLGAVVKATDSSKKLVWDAVRKPFGERTVNIGLIEVPLGFPGQYYDQETGNYYNYFRDYDPATGRYLQSDPVGLQGGINTYSYALNNPLYWIDPTGEFVCGGVCIGVGVGVIAAGTAISMWWQNTGGPDSIYPGNSENYGGPAPRPDPHEARKTQKERATDKPSWVDSYTPRGPNESCSDYADRVLNDHYGCDDPRASKRGPGSEHSKIKKWCERSNR
jgi:RHS repeat-associated protein